MKRTGPPKRKTGLKAKKGFTSKPKKIPHPSELPKLPRAHVRVHIPKGTSDRDQAASFRFVTMAKNRGRCVWPKCRRHAEHAHHVVYKSKCPEGTKYDARNGIPLCHDHHWTQHYGNERLPLNKLLPENLEFAREVLGAAADDYLRRRYAVEP